MKTFLIALAGLAAVPLAHAEDLGKLHFSGFGTLGVAFSDNEASDYTANFEQLEGVGKTTSKDYGLDSILGFQAETDIAEGLTATAQMQSRRLADGTSTPYFEWANLKYRINADLSVRAGRVVAPMFMVSESRAIGYAQTTARLPPDVYNVNPITYVDGGGVTYNFELGNVLYTANATAGKLEQKLPTFFGEIRSDFDVRLINLSAESGASTFRIGYAQVDIDFANETLDLLGVALSVFVEAQVPNAAMVQENVLYEGFSAKFIDFGYVYDGGDYLIQSEYVMRRTESFMVYDIDAFFILGAYRIDNWTPFIRYAQDDCKNSLGEAPVIDATGYGDFFTTIATEVNGFTDSLKIFDERKTWTVGARWDLMDNYALKLQYDRVSKPAGQSGFFVNSTDAFVAENKTVNVYSVILDFVF